jgi:hypothetical protein
VKRENSGKEDFSIQPVRIGSFAGGSNSYNVWWARFQYLPGLEMIIRSGSLFFKGNGLCPPVQSAIFSLPVLPFGNVS